MLFNKMTVTYGMLLIQYYGEYEREKRNVMGIPRMLSKRMSNRRNERETPSYFLGFILVCCNGKK